MGAKYISQDRLGLKIDLSSGRVCPVVAKDKRKSRLFLPKIAVLRQARQNRGGNFKKSRLIRGKKIKKSQRIRCEK